MANIVVLDDDMDNLRHTCALVEQVAPKDAARKVYTATSPDELRSVVASIPHVDIFISDVMMPDDQPSGIDVVEQLFPASSGTQVIYVSGFLNQAMEVYRTEHLYFLLKPLDPEKLRDALQKAYAALSARAPRMLRITSDHKEHMIRANSIRYIESNLHKASVHCGATTYVTYAKLDDLQAQLPSSFSRCHRSYLVNLAYVSALDKQELRLHDGTTIPVSRQRTNDVKSDLLAFIAGQ